MNRWSKQSGSIPPVVAGLAYLGSAILLLWMGFQPPDTVSPQDLQALSARSDLDRQRAEALIALTKENGRLGNLLLGATTGGETDALRRIRQSLETNGEALEKLAADSRRQADAANRLAEERAKDRASKIGRQRWLAGITVFPLVFLAFQAFLVRGRPRTDRTEAPPSYCR